MWLLDANLDIHLIEVLATLGITAQTAGDRGWKAFRNGELVSASSLAGFDCLRTRDRLFAESASQTWKEFPGFAIVVVTIPQMPSKRYIDAFAGGWSESPIRPQPGQILIWP